MVHNRLPRSHHSHLSIYPTVELRLVSRRRRNVVVSIARRWQLASRGRLLQILCQPDAS